jgi:hypothetical protein
MMDGVTLEEREESGGEMNPSKTEAKTDAVLEVVVVVVVVAEDDADVAMRRDGGLIVTGRSDIAVRAVAGWRPLLLATTFSAMLSTCMA